MASGFFRRYVAIMNLVKRSEVLDELPEVSFDARRASFVSRLLKSESLPFDNAVSEGTIVPRASGLFAAETLPLDDRPESRGKRAPFIATLFSREQLPVDPVSGTDPAAGGHGP